MVARLRSAALRLGVLSGALAVASFGCERVPLLAPTGSVITLTTATATLGLNGSAEIVAQVIEPAGTPPHSGTHVSFIASLGSVDPPEVQTDINGRATTRFQAGTASGIATITASSGGSSVAAGGAIKIAVGSAAVGGIVASASPAIVSSQGGSSTITAKVTDTGGNILAGVPVTFGTDLGSLNPTVANTDASGTATSVLTTNRTAKVTTSAGVATTTVGADGKTTTTAPATATVTVTVNQTASITLGPATPSSPTVGQSVAFAVTYASTATSGASPITRLRVEWGDGQANEFSGTPASLSHVYNSAGGFLVVVTGFDALGDTTSTSGSVTVTPRARPTVTISASTSNPVPNLPVTFSISATATTGNQIVSISVDFGDGQGTTLGGNATSVQHVFNTTGTYTVTATATDSTGQSGSASTVIVLADNAPTAAFTISPTVGTVATTFQFNASDSTGQIVNYAWDFGDGLPGTTGLTTSHKFGATGTYTIRLTVTDGRGRTATKTLTLTVTT